MPNKGTWSEIALWIPAAVAFTTAVALCAGIKWLLDHAGPVWY